MGPHEVLVSLHHADGIAAVVRERRGLWLTGDLARGGSTGLSECRPGVEGLSGDRTVQGGRLPPGAVTVEVVDDAGVRHRAAAANGAWVVVLDQPTIGQISPVCFLDGEGQTVAPALPADWHRVPVDDAPECCPACEASEWDEVQSLDDSRGAGRPDGGLWQPTPFVVCRRCGHEEPIGVWFAESAEPERANPGAVEVARARGELQHRRRGLAALENLDFPVWVAAGRPGRLVGWGSRGRGKTTSVSVDHGDLSRRGPAVRVETEREEYAVDGESTLVRRALEHLLGERTRDWPQRSGAGLTVWLRHDERARRRLAANAAIRECAIPLEGRNTAFQLAGTESCWAAVRRHDDAVITVYGRDIPVTAVELDRVDDPVAVLLGAPPVE